MHRALFKILVGLAVTLGLALTAAPAVHAASATEAITARAAAPSCAAQKTATKRAAAKYRKAKRGAHHARAALRRAKARHASRKVVAHAKHRVKVKVRKARKAKRQVKNARARRAVACRSTPQNPSPPPTASSPIQSLCAAGAPQAVCDTLAGLIPGGTANPLTTTLGQLCAQAPQAQPLCDLLNGDVPTDPQQLTQLTDALQSLLATVLANLDPTQAQAALTSLLAQIGAPDQLDPGILQALLQTLLGELGLDGLLDDILSGLGGLGGPGL